MCKQRLFLLSFLAALAVGLGACQRSGSKPYASGAEYGEEEARRGEVTVTPGSAAGFLRTNYEPLEQWMDERFRVRYENMPLEMVFEQKPIADIRYQLRNVPSDAPLFYLVSSSISRRELLKEIAQFYNLNMRVEMVNGEPGYVVVSGRGTASAAVPEPPMAASSFVDRPASAASSSASPDPVPRAKPAVEEGVAVEIAAPSPGQG